MNLSFTYSKFDFPLCKLHSDQAIQTLLPCPSGVASLKHARHLIKEQGNKHMDTNTSWPVKSETPFTESCS